MVQLSAPTTDDIELRVYLDERGEYVTIQLNDGDLCPVTKFSVHGVTLQTVDSLKGHKNYNVMLHDVVLYFELKQVNTSLQIVASYFTKLFIIVLYKCMCMW